MAKEDIQKKLEDGKLQRGKTKKEREDEAKIQVGMGKKKGGKKASKKEEEEHFDIDITFINLFGFLKVSPPLNKDALDEKITELQKKTDDYLEQGNKKLKDEEEKLEEGKLDDDEEPKPEREDEYPDAGYQPRRGGRGGRGGRGDRGGYRGDRGGNRGRGGFRPRNRSEDEYRDAEEEEEEKRYQESQQQYKAKRPNEKENLTVDADNFPTL